MKKNPRNEIRGIVFLLVACLIWGIYVLNAEAATDYTFTIYDSQGNEVSNGSTAMIYSDFSAKITVPLNTFAYDPSDAAVFTADATIRVGTTPYGRGVKGQIKEDMVEFVMRDLRCNTAGPNSFCVENLTIGYNGTYIEFPGYSEPFSIEIVKYERVVTGFSVTGYREGSGGSLNVDYGTFITGNYNGLNYPNDYKTPKLFYKLQEEEDGAYVEYSTLAPPYGSRQLCGTFIL